MNLNDRFSWTSLRSRKTALMPPAAFCALLCAAASALASVSASADPAPRITLGIGHRPLAVYSSPARGTTDPGQQVELEFALNPRNGDQIPALLQSLKNPHDPLYGHYLTPAQYRARFGRTQSEIGQVIAYAQRHNFKVLEVKPNNLFVRVSGRVSDVNAAFGMTLNNYVSPDLRDSGRLYHAPDREPMVDADVAPLIHGILGLDNAAVAHTDTRFTPLASRPVAATYLDPMQPHGVLTPAGGEQSFTSTGKGGLSPYDTDNLYGFFSNKLNGTTVAATNQVLACAEEGTFTRSDISEWLTNYTYGSGVPLEIYSVDGYNTGSTPSGASAEETTLDLDMMLTFAYKAGQIQVYENSPSGTSLAADVQEFTDEFTAMANAQTPPTVISVSYGFPENFLSQSDVEAEGEALSQLALQGQTVCVASGDTGAYADETSSTPNVDDPGSQPTVVCVGGTDLQDDIESNGSGNYATYVSESAWFDASDTSRGKLGTGSGGGISKFWTLPYFQSGAFTASGNPQGSTTMRNTPDVSIFGDFDDGSYSIYYTDAQTGQSGWGGGNGTSAAAPLWAGLLGCVNQIRDANNVPNIGEATPDIYQIAESSKYATDFHDIDDGSTNGYYKAVTGYDSATGWGSPKNAIQLISDLSQAPYDSAWEVHSSGTTVMSGQTLSAAVLLQEPASENNTFTISSSNTNVFTVPSSVTVAKGATSAPFTITAKTVTQPTQATISVTFDGVTAVGTITVDPASTSGLKSVTLSPTSVVGGSAATTGNRVYWNGDAPANETVTLKSSNTAVATVPSSVTISSGSSSHTFTITTQAVTSSTNVTITATCGGVTQTATLTVTPAAAASGLKSVSLDPTSTTGGTSTTGNRVYWNGDAPVNETVTLKSSNTSVATVPSTVTISSGSSSHTFTITTSSVTSSINVTITATSGGTTETATLTVTPSASSAGLKSVTLSPTSTPGGTTTTENRIYWNGDAPANETVTLKSSNTAVATVPSSVTISSGSSSHTFSVTTKAVTSQQTVTITATAGGVTQTATLTVTPASSTIVPTSISCSPNPSYSDGTTTATVQLSGPAPSGGLSISLSDNGTAFYTDTVPAGQSSYQATFDWGAVTSASTQTIGATANNTTVTTNVTLDPTSVTLKSFSYSPSTVEGGDSSTATVTLSAAAPSGGAVVEIDLDGDEFTTLTIPAGKTSGTYTVTAPSVTSTTEYTFTASYNNASKTATLTVTP